ncbi:coenzyme F420-reducing hydrogenase, FrhD protein [Methanopyrus sp.]
MLSFLEKRVLIVGCGNELFGDDGFGPAVVREIERRGWSHPDAEVIDAGSGAPQNVFSLIDEESRVEFIIVVDAVDVGEEPGTLLEFGPEDLSPDARIIPVDAHGWSVEGALLELRERAGVDFRIIGCQVKELPIPEVRPGMSRPVRRAVPRAAERAIQLAERYLSRRTS